MAWRSSALFHGLASRLTNSFSACQTSSMGLRSGDLPARGKLEEICFCSFHERVCLI